jgi:hypothetical protein
MVYVLRLCHPEEEETERKKNENVVRKDALSRVLGERGGPCVNGAKELRRIRQEGCGVVSARRDLFGVGIPSYWERGVTVVEDAAMSGARRELCSLTRLST